jgi:hypothetical protein
LTFCSYAREKKGKRGLFSGGLKFRREIWRIFTPLFPLEVVPTPLTADSAIASLEKGNLFNRMFLH